jgi:hypothetical protein
MVRHSLPVKCRLDEPPLRSMERVFTGEETFPHDGAPSLHHRAPRVSGGMCHQKLLNQVRMIQQKCVLPAKAKVDNIAVAVGKVLQKSNGMTAKS